MAAEVAGLFTYPIKGCKGISLDKANVATTGLQFDRTWMVVNKSGGILDGKVITQRQTPKLCLVEVNLPPEALSGGWGTLGPDAAMVLKAPGMEVLEVQLKPPEGQKVLETICWEWKGKAVDEGDDAAKWFTEFMGAPCRLVRYAGDGTAFEEGWRREVEPEFAPGADTAFSDGFPMLCASEEALADLNTRLPEPVSMMRFRPNIILRGMPSPWADDRWGSIKVGGVEFDYVKPCSRCTVTTVDPEKGEFAGSEPLATLGKFRSGELLGFGGRSWRKQAYFAWNLKCKSPVGSVLSVGDTVEVVAEREFKRSKQDDPEDSDEEEEDDDDKDDY